MVTDANFTEVVRLAEQLTPEEQQALIMHLEEQFLHRQEQIRDTHRRFNETFDLLVFDVGAWPDGLTLRREDEC